MLRAEVDVLRRLSDAFGPPNDESDVRSVLREELRQHAASISEDRMGNVFFYSKRHAGKPVLMLSAHMDEVALMTTHVEDSGFLRFHTLGGITDHVLPGQRILLRGSSGYLAAIIGTKPPHIMTDEERKRLVPRDELFMDVGARSAAEAKEKGVNIGTVGVFDVRFQDLGNGFFLGKSLDDRAGCAVMALAFKELAALDLNVVAVGTAQEEVGLRGAHVAAWQVDPDFGLALEGTFAADVPGSKPHETSAKLGGGPVVTIADQMTLTHPQVLKAILDSAKDEGIRYQFKEVPRGGTDAGAIHLTRAGVPSGTIAVPCRYIHGPASVFLEDDLLDTVRLTKAFAKRISSM